MNREKHLYIAAGAGMMLILILAAAVFFRNAMAGDTEAHITAEQAKQIALGDAGESIGDVTFTKTKLDWESGIPIYEVDFYTDEKAYDYEINAQTGIVREKKTTIQTRSGRLRQEEDDAGSRPEISTAQVPAAVIGVNQAQEAALKSAGLTADQVTFYRTSLETDDGVLAYEVEFTVEGREYEYTIDAATGAVLEAEMEMPENESDAAPAPAEEEPERNGQEPGEAVRPESGQPGPAEGAERASSADGAFSRGDDDDDRDDDDRDDDDDGDDRDDDDDGDDDDDDGDDRDDDRDDDDDDREDDDDDGDDRDDDRDDDDDDDDDRKDDDDDDRDDDRDDDDERDDDDD